MTKGATMTSMLEKLDAALAIHGPRKGPKLTQMDMRAAYAATRRGFKHWIVADCFDLSQSTVSQMSTAHPDSRRYSKLAREWNELGPHAFCEKYLSEHHLEALQRIRVKRPAPGDVRKRPGDENANKYQGVHELYSNDQNETLQLEIAYRAAGQDEDSIYGGRAPARWAHRDLRWPGHWTSERHRTSHDCWDSMCATNGVENPRKRAGRPAQ